MSREQEIRNNRSTSTKWQKYPNDVLPAWIADMDLGVAPEIAQVLTERIACGDLGYPSIELQEQLLDAFSDRYLDRFNTPLDPALAVVGTDVVQSIVISILTLTNPGDGVIVQTPIYPPFMGAVNSTNRNLLENPLVMVNDEWIINFDELERLAQERSTTLFLLCSPHNPTGRVFTQEELVKIANICAANNVLVVSDEIHCDIVYSPNYHIPFASISPEFASNVVTMNSATKSFNIAGLRCSVTHFGSEELKAKYDAYDAAVRGSISSLSMLATTAAWQKGDAWLASTLSHLEKNRRTLTQFVTENNFGLSYRPPQGTYLGWLDFRKTKAASGTAEYLINNAKVALSPGIDFGTPGDGWARLNFATSEDLLVEILNRIKTGLEA